MPDIRLTKASTDLLNQHLLAFLAKVKNIFEDANIFFFSPYFFFKEEKSDFDTNNDIYK